MEQHSGFSFNPSFAPPTSKFTPPSWVSPVPVPPKNVNVNGLGEPFDLKHPVFRGIDLTKPDPRLRVPSLEISGTDPNNKILFRDVNILNSTSGAEPFRGDVLVHGERIVSAGTTINGDMLKGARVIEGGGRTLMSGLVDAHTHFTWPNAASLNNLGNMNIEEHTIFSAKSARTFLDCGYTMCLGAASAQTRLDVVIRNAINKNDIPGPRSLANSKELSPRTGALVDSITAYVDGPEEIERVVKGHVSVGADQIKLSMSGEEITGSLRAEDTTWKDADVALAVELAHAAGIRVCSHARSDESIMQCLQYGVDIIYHASFISDSTMDALEAQKNRVFVAPAINWLVATLQDAEKYGYPTEKAEKAGYARELEISIAALREMHRRGIRVLPGGDYGFAWTPHGTYRDLEHFVHLLGYTPMEAILAATALGGEIMMHPHELGKILPGYYADLILVNGNPLEDIGILSHADSLDMVMINGRIHK